MLLVFCKAGPAIPVVLHLSEHDAGRLKMLIEERAGEPDQAGGSYWPELLEKINHQIAASYEQFFERRVLN